MVTSNPGLEHELNLQIHNYLNNSLECHQQQFQMITFDSGTIAQVSEVQPSRMLVITQG